MVLVELLNPEDIRQEDVEKACEHLSDDNIYDEQLERKEYIVDFKPSGNIEVEANKARTVYEELEQLEQDLEAAGYEL